MPAAEEPTIRLSWDSGSPPDSTVPLIRAGNTLCDAVSDISICEGLGLMPAGLAVGLAAVGVASEVAVNDGVPLPDVVRDAVRVFDGDKLEVTDRVLVTLPVRVCVRV